MSRYTFYGLIFQMALTGMLMASNGKAQSDLKLDDIYLSLKLKNETLKDVFDEITKQTQLKFAYEEGRVGLSKRIDVKASKSSLRSVLTKISRKNRLSFKRIGSQIFVLQHKNGFFVLDGEETKISPDKTISGKVTDENGNGLPGVNIIIKDTNIGVVTDINGNYALNVPDDATILVFSYVGYITEEVNISGRTVIDFVLTPDLETLSEVIVVGYATRDRKTVAGAIEQVSGEMLQNRPITNVVNGLQGVIPGLAITRNTGQPGQEGYRLQIRGISTINSSTNNVNDGGGNSPLILIDGIEGDLNTINPNDIQSATVLKDASAAIYGARAAGGVILITTKTGSKGQAPRITYSNAFSINKISRTTDLVNMREFVEMDIAAVEATGGTTHWQEPEVAAKVLAGSRDAEARWGPNDPARLFFVEDNWEDAIYDDGGIQQNHNLSMIGGGEASDYAISIGYNHIDGILKDTWDASKRLNVRFNYGFQISDKIKFDSRVSYERQNTVQPTDGSARIVHGLVDRFHWLPIYTKDGEYLTQWGFANVRQLADKENGKRTDITETLRGNFNLSYEIIDGLKVNGQFGINRTVGDGNNFGRVLPAYSYENGPVGFNRRNNFASEASSTSNYKNLTGFIDYRKVINGSHDISVMAGASHEENEREDFRAWRENFSQDQIWALNQGAVDRQFNEGSASHWAIRSFFGRLTYVFNSKYIAELNFRRDGTSVFSPNKRWGNFTGVSLAWLASEESFVQNLNIFDHLKLKVSRGTVGNQNLNTGNLYDYIPLITIDQVYPFGNGERAQSARERGLVSQNRTWEDVTTTNVGIEFALLNSRLSGTIDLYRKENSNMLLGVNLPSVLGGAPPAQNIGTLETKGYEITLGWADKVNDDFSYSIRVVFDDNTNELTDLDGRDLVRLGSNVREGYALGTYFGYAFDGFIQNQEELDAYRQLDGVPGDIGIGDTRFKDLNGDGRISLVDADGNDADIVNLGTNAPRKNFGVNLGVKFKNFDVSAFVQGVAKRTIFYNGDFRLPFVWPWRTPLRRFYNNTWTPENPDAKFPRLTHGGIRFWNYEPSAMNQVNGAYARLKNITIGYTIPNHITERVGVQNFRVFFSGEDLVTIDSVEGGYDPEHTNGSPSNYPFTKRYSLGLSLSF
ncbi:TonB-dependent receptor [Fulvivirgaceae bacterium BMA10]|uniref:TonB-dependent receptor n=1 Tax=Splendidivirga corallicola TaxID=3051826 RepID=A0ABT8KWB8_9BACT|nr:TonB-dependent receptor [Fulvivirgaceae bacterium BMA10]